MVGLLPTDRMVVATCPRVTRAISVMTSGTFFTGKWLNTL
jgi:hypothetical protein